MIDGHTAGPKGYTPSIKHRKRMESLRLCQDPGRHGAGLFSRSRTGVLALASPAMGKVQPGQPFDPARAKPRKPFAKRMDGDPEGGDHLGGRLSRFTAGDDPLSTAGSMAAPLRRVCILPGPWPEVSDDSRTPLRVNNLLGSHGRAG